MKKSVDEHASRFDDAAEEYDEGEHSDEYETAVALVLEHAGPTPEDTVLDLGTGTGVLALALAEEAGTVLGRDISAGMLEEARRKAQAAELGNIDFGTGSFREPNVETKIDVVVSNFAMHHLDDEAKRAAIAELARLEPRRIVLGDVMFFGEPDPDEPFYDPAVDDPATVGTLVDAFTDEGYAITAVERIHDQVGVIVATRWPPTDGDSDL